MLALCLILSLILSAGASAREEKIKLPLIYMDPYKKAGFLEGLFRSAPQQRSKAASDATTTTSVLLLPMYGGSKSDWTPLAQRLNESGFAVLALDFRDKGHATGSMPFVEDIQSGVAYLKSRSSSPLHSIHIIAAGVGANGALQYATVSSLMPQVISSLTLLSPGEILSGMDAVEAISHLANIPVLLVAAKDDDYSFKTLKKLKTRCPNFCEELDLEAGGQGTNLLKSAGGSKAIQTMTQFVLKPRNYGIAR